WRMGWTRPASVTRRPALPDIRTFLDLSTAHLPEQMCDRLGAIPGVVAHQTVYGWLMRVPDHPADPDEHDSAPIPEVVLTIQRYARAAGCAYVLFDADADRIDALPT